MASFVAINNTILFLAIAFTSWAYIAMAQGGGGEGGGGGKQPPCVQKLLPCQPYLHGNMEPPAVCCLPLKHFIDDDSQCLCSIFNNDALLKSFNVTKDDALDLPKRCGKEANLDDCKNGGTAPSPDSSSVSSPPPPSTYAPPTTGDSSAAVDVYDQNTIAGVAVAVLTVGWAFFATLVW